MEGLAKMKSGTAELEQLSKAVEQVSQP
jgi:hypothetical protein